MNSRTKGVSLLAISAALLAGGVYDGTIPLPHSPVPIPGPKPNGPDLLSVFSKSADKRLASEHAKALSTICFTLADVIEADGKESPPRLTKGVQLDQLRIAVRQYRLGGASLKTTYPEIEGVMATHFENHVGKSGGPFDASLRPKWVDAFKEAGECAKYASQRL